MALVLKELTVCVIGAAIQVHLRAVGRRHGLLLNFSRPTIEAKRVIADDPT